jgi:ABC-type nitrate/sulfonate/bicarbonate transport system permease component
VGLNAKLNETRQLANDCNKLRSSKSIWSTVLGVGIGFGLGILLGVVVN